jgi:hypothetical protein
MLITYIDIHLNTIEYLGLLSLYISKVGQIKNNSNTTQHILQ